MERAARARRPGTLARGLRTGSQLKPAGVSGSDDGRVDGDQNVVTGGLRVRADLVGACAELVCGLLVDAAELDVQRGAEQEIVQLLVVVQGDIRDHRQVLHDHLLLRGDALDRSEEARRPARGEKLLRIGGSPGPAHRLWNSESDVEKTVVRQCAASVATLSGRGDDSGVRGLGHGDFLLCSDCPGSGSRAVPTVGSVGGERARRMTLSVYDTRPK